MENKFQASVFISASIQEPGATGTAYDVDKLSLRHALIACIESIFAYTDYRVIWGGHPTITNLIAYILKTSYGLNLKEEPLSPQAERIKSRLFLYQSAYFKSNYPIENKLFNVVEVVAENTRDASLTSMRNCMLGSEQNIVLGIFMGGKREGLSEEFNILRSNHPSAVILPLSKTGGYSAELLCTQKLKLSKYLYDLCDSYRFYDLFETLNFNHFN